MSQKTLRLSLMGEDVPRATSSTPFPRFVIPMPSHTAVESETRRMSSSAPERTLGAVTTPLERLIRQTILDGRDAPRLCARCSRRNTMVPWVTSGTLVCMNPLGTTTCGYIVHTTLSPQVCPIKSCRGGQMAIERHFDEVGYACHECRRFEPLSIMQGRIAKEASARLAKEAKTRTKALRDKKKKEKT